MSQILIYILILITHFFRPICPIEDIDWFSKAFWDVNSYGLTLARKLSQYLKTKKDITRISGSQRKNILFVFKGPFSLAHSNVLNDLLNGSIEACQNTDIYLLLLDNPAIQIPNVKVFSFANLSLTSHKLEKFIALTRKVAFHNIVWVACIQNLALYMGIDLSRHSTYWTMKRHSIVFPEINRYATFISQHRNTNYNGAFWYGGRYRLKVVPTIKDKISIISQVQNINDKRNHYL